MTAQARRPLKFRIVMVIAVLAVASPPNGVHAQQGTAATQDQEKATLLHFCQQLDQAPEQTLQAIRDRTDCWKRMQLQGMDDSVVDAGYRAAVADYDAASANDSLHRAGDSIAGALTDAQQKIQGRDLDGALRELTAVLAAQPDNQRALAMRDRAAALRQAARARTRLYIIAGAVLLLALAFMATARVIANRHRRQVVRRGAAMANQKAALEVVDGIGRGKVFTMDGPMFRIGSAESERPEERNDMILSDAGAFISRYHCAIIRRNGDFFLIDSSLNGTYMDDDLLQRGEHRLLQDGAEFSLAGMARIKFLLM